MALEPVSRHLGEVERGEKEAGATQNPAHPDAGRIARRRRDHAAERESCKAKPCQNAIRGEPAGKPGREGEEQARSHEQPDHQADLGIVEPERIREISSDRGHCLELKAKTDARGEEQGENAPAHHAQPS